MKITTKQNEKVLKDFLKHEYMYHLKLILVGLIMFNCAAMFGFFSGSGNGKKIAIMIWFVSALFLVFYLVFLFVSSKKHKISKEELVLECEFLEECFRVKIYKDNKEVEQVEDGYDGIYSVDITNTYVFVYLAPYFAYCLPKSDIDENDLKELKQLFFDNGIRCNYSKR